MLSFTLDFLVCIPFIARVLAGTNCFLKMRLQE